VNIRDACELNMWGWLIVPFVHWERSIHLCVSSACPSVCLFLSTRWMANPH